MARVTLEGQSYNRHETGHSEWRPIPFEEWRFHAASSDTPAHALALFDFSQRLVDIWHRSNSQDKRQIVDCVSLNRTLSDVTLVLAKRSPFDYLAERPFLKDGRGDCRNFEPSRAVAPFAGPFLAPPEPFILDADRLVRAAG